MKNLITRCCHVESYFNAPRNHKCRNVEINQKLRIHDAVETSRKPQPGGVRVEVCFFNAKCSSLISDLCWNYWASDEENLDADHPTPTWRGSEPRWCLFTTSAPCYTTCWQCKALFIVWAFQRNPLQHPFIINWNKQLCVAPVIGKFSTRSRLHVEYKKTLFLFCRRIWHNAVWFFRSCCAAPCCPQSQTSIDSPDLKVK